MPTILRLFLSVFLDRFGFIFRFLLWDFFLVVVCNCFKWALTSFNDMIVVWFALVVEAVRVGWSQKVVAQWHSGTPLSSHGDG